MLGGGGGVKKAFGPTADDSGSWAAPAGPSESPRLAINAAWFGKLRWVAVVGQLVTIAFVGGPLGVRAPIAPLLTLVGLIAVSNALYWWWATSRPAPPTRNTWHAVLGGLMLLDLVVLTAMLALSGGPTNPFFVFYFVNLALSGVVLPAAWSWVLSAVAIGSFALLAFAHTPVDVLRDPARLEPLAAVGSDAPLASLGSWVAFAACAVVIVSFTTRLTAELRASDRLRRRAERDRARAEKLEALGTLAAGAAHELATPLSTIAVAVSEAHRSVRSAPEGDPAVAEDLELVRREVDRCRTILQRMASETGQPAADMPRRLAAGELFDAVVSELPARDRVAVEFADGADALPLVAPPTALAQAVRAVVQNALDATDSVDPNGVVRLCGDRLAGTLRVRVIDSGPGMTPDAIRRATEPFFTTKEPGRGMGLGLFLTRSVVERLGGSLRLESPADGGAMATLVLPLDEPAATASPAE